MRSPSTDPGQSTFTRIPNSPTSMASVSPSPTMAYLEAAYGERIGNPVIPAVDEVNRIEPPPAARMAGTARRQQRKALRTLTAMVRSQPSTSRSSTGPVGPAMPTFAHSTSRPPRPPASVGASNSSNRSSTPAGSETSTPVKPQPSGSPPRASARSATWTRAPASPNASAMARPMPEAPPVISTRCGSVIGVLHWLRSTVSANRSPGTTM